MTPTSTPFARRFRHRLLAFGLALVTAWTAPPALAQVRLPSMGDSATQDFNAGAERRLGEQIMRSVVRDPDYLDDPILLQYLLGLWEPLVRAARSRGEVEPDVDQAFAWEVFLVRDRSVNAFALPGGWVGVHLGLIALTASRDQLASVLAHELSHVSQRHIARNIVNSQRQSMVSLAGMLLAILAASRTQSADAVQAAAIGGQAVAIQGQLNFSREMEREADRIGFGILQGAGYATEGMAAMFEKLDHANRLNDSGAFPYLRTHPLTVERMAEARSRALIGHSDAASAPWLHALMQARARVLMDTNPQALRRLQEPLSGPGAELKRDRLGQLYAGALASMLLREHATAQSALKEAERELAAAQPRDPQAEQHLRWLQAQLMAARGEPQRALQALDAAGGAGLRAPLMLRAQAALDWHHAGGGEPAQAELRRSTEALQTWVAEHRRDGRAWVLLSATAEAAGLRLRALRANAEARAAEGDLNGAIDRLRAAQGMARGALAGQDFVEASIIDARLRELTAQRRRLLFEMRGGREPMPGESDQLP